MTKEGEARPTEVTIFENPDETIKTYKLTDELDELDFVFGHFPVSYKEAEESEDLFKTLSRHIKEKKQKTSLEKSL
ncbi:hypothetical protein KGQ29_01475 [Patescibacteria group bacterium]|nr:hypothetical protein [Patescibacteria group bacterium]